MPPASSTGPDPRPPVPYRLTDDPAELPLEQVQRLLAGTHWARHRRPEVQRRAMQGSVNLGAVHAEHETVLAYARVVSDRATFAYLCDVVVAPSHRGRGIGTALMAYVDAHPDLQGLRRWVLATTGAHRLYEAAGWRPVADPGMWMERFTEDAARPWATR